MIKQRWHTFIPGEFDRQPHLYCVGSSSESSPAYSSKAWALPDSAGARQRCVLQYTIEGCGAISYQGNVYRVEAGKAFVFPRTVSDVFYYYPPREKVPWSFVFCEFCNLNAAVEQLNARHGPVYEFGQTGLLVQKLLDLLERQTQRRAMISCRDSFRICSDIIEEMDRIVELKDSAGNGSLATAARDLIFRRREEDFSLSVLAEMLGVTPEHLCREFRRELGVPPKQYHNQLRAKAMQEWLINGSTPTKQIARHFGFENTTNFIAFFKKHTGVTPGEFRQR